MVVEWQSHAQFQHFLLSQFSQRYGSVEKQKILNFYQSTIAKVWLTDLTPAIPILEPCYASTRRGKAPRDPLAMLRAFLVMSLEGYVSITKWVRALRTRPLLAILCGFEPNETPGVGTFYEFIDRLWLAPRHTESRQKPFVPKPRRRGKRNEKLETPKHPGSVERLVNRIAKYQDAPAPPAPFDVVMNLFKHCFVLPSAHFGLLGDPSNLSLAGDGTTVRSGSSRFGRKTCSCHQQGIYDCQCPRSFSDPNASWGWDSYREEYFWGRSLYEFVASDSPYDLPVYFMLAAAQRHDSILCVSALDRARKFYPEFSFSELSLDAAHDAYPIYCLLDSWNITPIIAANPRKNPNPEHEKFHLTATGVPICQCGMPMVYNGLNLKRRRTKWRCPVAAGKLAKCLNPKPCSSSPYGRVVYTTFEENLRLFRAPPRDSALWKKKYKKRSASERSNKRKKCDYHLEDTRVRDTKHWYFRTFITASLQHIDAWFKHFEKKVLPNILQDLYTMAS